MNIIFIFLFFILSLILLIITYFVSVLRESDLVVIFNLYKKKLILTTIIEKCKRIMVPTVYLLFNLKKELNYK